MKPSGVAWRRWRQTFWLVLNLPFPQLIILLKRAHVPRLLTEQILLTWRFIFILLDEALAIHRAQTLRFGYRSLPLGYRSLAMLVGFVVYARVDPLSTNDHPHWISNCIRVIFTCKEKYACHLCALVSLFRYDPILKGLTLDFSPHAVTGLVRGERMRKIYAVYES